METFLMTGANRGLGLGLVTELVARSDTFVVAAIRSSATQDLRKIAAQNPDRLMITPMHLADQDSILAAAAEVSKRVDHLDVLVNNAAAHPPAGEQSFKAVTRDQMMQVFEVNAVTPFLVVRAFLELLRRSSRPRIVNISSERGSMAWQAGHGGYYSYSLGKAGLNMLPRLLAVDLAPHNVITISVHPGWMRTQWGGAHAALSPAESAHGILELIGQLTPGQNGGFYKWNAEVHPWQEGRHHPGTVSLSRPPARWLDGSNRLHASAFEPGKLRCSLSMRLHRRESKITPCRADIPRKEESS